MAVLLFEAAKQLPPAEEFRSAIVQIFAAQTEITAALPFENIQGSATRWNSEGALPTVGFRKVNGTFTSSQGVFDPAMEPLVILGGDLDVDRFIVSTMGQNQRTIQETLQLKALAHKFSHTFIKGDAVTTTAVSDEFNGLQLRCLGTQLVSAGATSGGDPLSLFILDQAIARTDNPTHLIMSQAMKRRFSQAQRSGLYGQIQLVPNQAGIQILMYQGLPILVADSNGDVNASLAFDEAAVGGGTTATSIYIVSFRSGMLTGIQNSVPQVDDLGLLQAGSQYRTRFEWYCNFAIWQKRAATRLWGISNAALVA